MTCIVPLAVRAIPATPFISKLVRSMMVSPRIRICGRTNRTSMMETIVPRPRQVPMAAITGFVVSTLIRIPADARMEPEVKMVGNDSFRAVTMASRGRMTFFRSV